MKELKWKSDKINDDIRREQDLLANEKSKFEVKKKEFLDFISQRLIDPMQVTCQAYFGHISIFRPDMLEKNGITMCYI